MGAAPEDPGEEVLFEITRLGDYQRCAAVHVATGVEVVVQAPANAAFSDVRMLAVRMLQRALGRQHVEDDEKPDRAGKLV